MNTHMEMFVPLTYCIMDHASLQSCTRHGIFQQRHELSSGRATAAFLTNFCSQLGSDVDCWKPHRLVKWKQVSPNPEGMLSVQEHCLAGRLKKKLVRDLAHERQYLLSQQHITVVCANNLHCRIDEYQVHFQTLGHTCEHYQWVVES